MDEKFDASMTPGLRLRACKGCIGILCANFDGSTRGHVTSDATGTATYQDNNTYLSREFGYSHDVDLVWALLVDMSLLCTFMLQHTVMARPVIKGLYNKLSLSIVERSVYNLTASLALQLLIQHWVALRDPVWRINTVEHNACWWMFAISHGYCWATIYLGSLTMDLSELLGIKQVYYYLNGWDDPLTLKSSELQRLISHQRHPSFVSFFFIFWVHPYMSVDRLIMAVIMTLYMVCAWKVDDIDFEYQERQFKRKEIELSHVH
uniref:Nuclear envelope membrane protein n=1 Tax=Timema cristinae TaxID=61476 RepID=A0A7R9CGK3_TIMCR|nr:unnamed protein product [Timema cristinae]